MDPVGGLQEHGAAHQLRHIVMQARPQEKEVRPAIRQVRRSAEVKETPCKSNNE